MIRAGSFSAKTPASRTLSHPYSHPDSCVVAATAQLSGSGNLEVTLGTSQSQLTSELYVTPGHFGEHLRLLASGADAQAPREAETLLADTITLVETRTDADTSSFCDELPRQLVGHAD